SVVQRTSSHPVHDAFHKWNNIASILDRYTNFVGNEIDKEMSQSMSNIIFIINYVIFQNYEEEDRDKMGLLVRNNLNDFVFPLHDQFILPLNEIENQTFQKFKGDRNLFSIITEHIYSHDYLIPKDLYPNLRYLTRNIE